MSISKEKIISNATKFNETGVKYGVINDDLLKLIGEEIIKAPCTTLDRMYNAFEGGLIQHILNVTKYAISINSSLPESKRIEVNKIIRVCILHQIGKSKMFIPQESEWHVKNKGEFFKFNNNEVSLKVGERSVYYALKSNIDLNEDEVFAILNYDFDFGNRELKTDGEKLASLLKVANLVAIISEK